MSDDFYKLGYEAQLARLEQYARARLHEWGISTATLTPVFYENNAVFRVDDAYALKIYRPGHQTPDALRAVAAWLQMLTEAGLTVPAPIKGVTAGHADGVAETVYSVLLRWIEGAFLPAADHTPAHAAAVGRFLGRLHTISQTHRQACSNLERPTLDYEGLFGARSHYHSTNESIYISAENQRVLDTVGERVRDVMAQMGRGADTFGLIHGDFIYKNTLFTPDGGVAAIDFDDCGFGYYLYDMACPLLFYKPLPNYDALKAALWEGYNTVRPLPPHYRNHLEVLIAGRYVASCRWVAGNAEHPHIRGRAKDIIEGRAAELRAFLETGTL